MCDSKVVALGHSYLEDLNGIFEMVSHLSSGFPPRSKDIGGLLPLAKEVLKRCEGFLRIKADDCPAQFLPMIKDGFLYGGNAVQYQFQQIFNDVGEGRPANPQEIKPLKQYLWLLDVEKQAIVQKWLNLLSRPVTEGSVKALVDAHVADESAVVVAPVAKKCRISDFALVEASPANAPSSSSNAAPDGQGTKKRLIQSFFAKKKA